MTSSITIWVRRAGAIRSAVMLASRAAVAANAHQWGRTYAVRRARVLTSGPLYQAIVAAARLARRPRVPASRRVARTGGLAGQRRQRRGRPAGQHVDDLVDFLWRAAELRLPGDPVDRGLVVSRRAPPDPEGRDGRGPVAPPARPGRLQPLQHHRIARAATDHGPVAPLGAGVIADALGREPGHGHAGRPTAGEGIPGRRHVSTPQVRPDVMDRRAPEDGSSAAVARSA